MRNPIVTLFKSRIYTALLLLGIVLVVGVVGYKTIADYSWVDALYMTVITMTTVGFGEVLPLDDQSKIFTVVLIIASVIIVGYALSVITD